MSYFLLFSVLILTSCATHKKLSPKENDISELRFIDELIIPGNEVVEGHEVGGLSALDYHNGIWYVLSDARDFPRFYKVEIPYDSNGFENYQMLSAHLFEDSNGNAFKNGIADPEALRVSNTGEILWSSEGDATKKIQPFIRKATMKGEYIEDLHVPFRYNFGSLLGNGPRNNGVFEAISFDIDPNYIWVATELPLIQDGSPPTFTTGDEPIRLSMVNLNTKNFEKEFVNLLDKVARPGDLEVNGVTEILAYQKNKLLVLERSYASGHKDGGNNIKIYKIELSNATEVQQLNSLKETPYIPVRKTLLLDLDTLRTQVDSGIIDNLEGMSFGPMLENGNRSLLLVSDNNFNAFGKQVTQFLLFEIK